MALNHYRLLGIPPDADQHRIKAVYRSLAKRFHPDANKGSETAAELFRQVNQAYRILSDPDARARYDRKLAGEETARKKKPSASGADPQQKFNRFVTSLLDALFGPAEAQVQPVPQQPRQTTNTSGSRASKPAFNFYYHVAMEKNTQPYTCGGDGIYRKTPKQKPNSGGGRNRRPPR